MKKIVHTLILTSAIFSSCEKNLPAPGGTAAEKVANEWWVQFTYGGEDIYGIGHFKIATYNTAANADSIWVDDMKNSWQFKCKAKVDYTNLTFNAANSADEYNGITVDISNGKIFSGLGVSRSGNVTDSIYMDITFSDDPGTVYTISGCARTRFAEDDY